jgi:nucleotide-binding universal stress UspA family protein
MLKTILVAVDGSEFTARVMQTLTELQLQPTTKTILVRVLPATESEVPVDRPQSNSEELLYRQIEKELQPYQAALPCHSELEIVTGDPATEIVRLAHIYSCDLIVIGSRGLTGMTRILQGSVSSQVLEDAPCSVLVVKYK